METRRHGHIDTRRHEDLETLKHGNIETWRHGHIDTRRHGDLETWKHGNIETWRHGGMEMETSIGRLKTEAQAISLTHLLSTQRANESLLFVRLLMKKQKEDISLETD